MYIAKAALLFEQFGQLLAEFDARQGFAIIAALIALCFREFGQHHFGSAAIAFVLHQFFCSGQAQLDLAALALGIALRLFLLCATDPVKSPMFVQVVDDARPFVCAQQVIQSLDAYMPRGF